MRIGEVRKLRWRDIDRTRGLVHVAPGKTARMRLVPLNMTSNLSEVLDRQPRRIGTDFVFVGPDGEPPDRHYLNRTLEAAMKKAEIPRTRGVRWKLLRKTGVSRLYASGRVLLQDEADVAGHSVAVAMRHYREFSPTSWERLSGALDATEPATGAIAGASEGKAS